LDRPLVVLDTETATFGGAPHLIELGAVRVVDGEIVEHFQELVRPEVPIEPEATAVHGITDDDVSRADGADRVVGRFLEWLGEDWLAAHNAKFDGRVIGFECARYGHEAPRAPMIDSVPLARKHLPESPDHKLATLTEHLGVDVTVHHRALDDAVSCWKVLEACIERMGGDVTASELLTQSGKLVTLVACVPGPPLKTPRRVRGLETARQEGATVVMTYGDSDTAPARLQVTPRMLYRWRERDYLEAECGQTGLLKTYRLDRVHKVEEARP
jgi:DNA polymerase III epsilon subunit family exonuclease